MAMTPARTPGPMMVTSIRAQMSELMERDETMMNSATGRTKTWLGVVLLAAQKAMGTAMTMARAVPRVAMLMVSQIGSQSLFM